MLAPEPVATYTSVDAEAALEELEELDELDELLDEELLDVELLAVELLVAVESALAQVGQAVLP